MPSLLPQSSQTAQLTTRLLSPDLRNLRTKLAALEELAQEALDPGDAAAPSHASASTSSQEKESRGSRPSEAGSSAG